MGRFVQIEELEERTLFTRALGIDVSSYQGEPNWTSIASDGIQFAYAKATQGNYYIDADFSYNMTNGTAAGVVMGAYDFADFTVNPNTEANYFLATAGPYVGAGYMHPMLDVEDTGSGDNASEISSWVNTWCTDVQNATGVQPIVYTYIDFADDYLNSSVTQWPLWMSNPNSSSVQTGGPNSTSPWSTWDIWQYDTSATLSGIPSGDEVDEDVANGDMTTFVIPDLVGASTQFTPGETVHVNATSGLKAWNTYQSNGTYVVESNNTNGIIEGNPVYIDGYLRFPVEYAGSSTVTWSAGAYLSAGGVPVVNGVTTSPNPVAMEAPLTLTASISDPDSTVSKVAFYEETNGTAGLQTGSGGDTLVGTATTGSSGNWSVTITSPDAVGTYTYYAVATDVSGNISAAGSGTSTVATSSILNPGFETPSIGSGSYGDYEYVPPGASWTFSGYSGISGNGSMFTSGNPNAPEGTQVGFLEYANSSVSQTVSMSAGTYQLDFFAAQRANLQASQQNFEVLIDGAVVSQFTPSSTAYQQYFTAPFTVSSGNHTIELLGLDSAGGNNTVLIDDVQMIATTLAAGQPNDSGFELPSVGSGSSAYQYDPNSPGWTFSGNAGITGDDSGFTAQNPNAPEGVQVAFLQMSGSSISQQLTLAAGTYSITFDAAQRVQWQSGQQNFEVLVDGNVVDQVTPVNGNYALFNTAAFTVAGGTHTIEFLGIDSASGDNTALIDNVQISTATLASGQPSDSGFESPSIGSGTSAYVYDPSGTAWQFSGNSGITGNGSAFTQDNANAPEGSQAAFLQMGGSSISQEVSLSAGTYYLSFAAAQRVIYQSGQQNFQVLVDGNVVGTFTPSGGGVYSQLATNSFTVAAGAHTIQFLGLDTAGGDNTAFIDNVQVTASPVLPSVADNGFESPSIGSGTLAYVYDPTGTAWTFSGNAGITGNGSGFTMDNPNAPEGSQAAFLQVGGSSISQQVTLASGTYVLDFSAAQRVAYQSGVQDFEVLVDGNVVGTFTPASSSYVGYSTASFTLSSGTHTIEFLGLDSAGGDNTALIDNVQLLSA